MTNNYIYEETIAHYNPGAFMIVNVRDKPILMVICKDLAYNYYKNYANSKNYIGLNKNIIYDLGCLKKGHNLHIYVSEKYYNIFQKINYTIIVKKDLKHAYKYIVTIQIYNKKDVAIYKLLK